MHCSKRHPTLSSSHLETCFLINPIKDFLKNRNKTKLKPAPHDKAQPLPTADFQTRKESIKYCKNFLYKHVFWSVWTLQQLQQSF